MISKNLSADPVVAWNVNHRSQILYFPSPHSPRPIMQGCSSSLEKPFLLRIFTFLLSPLVSAQETRGLSTIPFGICAVLTDQFLAKSSRAISLSPLLWVQSWKRRKAFLGIRCKEPNRVLARKSSILESDANYVIMKASAERCVETTLTALHHGCWKAQCSCDCDLSRLLKARAIASAITETNKRNEYGHATMACQNVGS